MTGPPPFKLFGPSHWAVLAVMVAVPALLALLVRRPGGERRIRPIAWGLASLLVANELGELFYIARVDPAHLRNHLPFQLCDWVIFTCIVALLLRRQLAFDLSYFWGLGGTLQAVLTPDLTKDFPSPAFCFFMIGHAGVIMAILFLILGMRMRPYPRSIARAFLWSQLYLLITAGINLALHANYGYLCRKPLQPSLLDALGPWPWYVVSLQAIALVTFALFYAPFFLADRIGRRRASSGGADGASLPASQSRGRRNSS